MKRREMAEEPVTGGRRGFTRSELAEIRTLTLHHPTADDLDRLRQIHAAAGCRRMLRAWEIDYPAAHDPVFAFREETDCSGDPDC